MITNVSNRSLCKPSRAKSALAWFLCLVFLANNMASATISNQQQAGTTKVLLCTSKGYQWTDIQSPDSDTSSTTPLHCAWCVNLESDVLIEPFVQPKMILSDLGRRTAQHQTITNNKLRQFERQLLRAPPLFL